MNLDTADLYPSVAPDVRLFPADALDANRQGRLTDTQRQQLTETAGKGRSSWTKTGLFIFGAGVVMLLVVMSGRFSLIVLLVGVGCVGVGGVAAWLGITGTDPLTRDVQSGRVESVEGAIARQALPGMSGRGGVSYSLHVSGRTFSADDRTYQAAPEAGYVKVYFLPHSNKIVNLERLPDHPLPAGVTPQQLSLRMMKSLFLGSFQERAEAGAAMATFQRGLGEGAAAARPPADQLDPRPLNEAILGAWFNPMMTLSFTSDGLATLSIAGKKAGDGRWSLDPDGTLHIQVRGFKLEGDAWVADDRLTMHPHGHPLVFTRGALA
jgi:hypothetical protein